MAIERRSAGFQPAPEPAGAGEGQSDGTKAGGDACATALDPCAAARSAGFQPASTPAGAGERPSDGTSAGGDARATALGPCAAARSAGFQPAPEPVGANANAWAIWGRRRFLAACAALFCAPALAARAQRLAATWQSGAGYQAGILVLHGDRVEIAAALDLPTRAHGLLREPEGTLLTAARRPGDWLLRWDARGNPRQWRWSEPRRAFTGHLIRTGDRLYTTETDLDSGAGLLGVRDAATLEKLAEWPSHGIDPHQLILDADGTLLLANGGVPTRPETGRRKLELETMDSSLVRLDPHSGQRLGQWRLPDRRLSLRHLARGAHGVGIALQAEHDDPAQRQHAPVLALFDGERLRVAVAPRSLAGYGGDIAAQDLGYAVSCPRAGGVARFGHDGEWRGFTPLAEACALASDPPLAGGRDAILGDDGPILLPPGVRLDNHWIALAA